MAGHTAAVGGAEIAQLRVVEGLAAIGWDVELLYVEAGDLWPRWRGLADKTTAVRASQPQRDAPLRSGLGTLHVAAEVGRSSAGVVYVHNPADLAAVLLPARVTRTPVVLHLHLPPPSRQPEWLNRLIRRSDAVIVPSRDARDRWTETAKIPAGKVHAIPTGIDTDRFAPLPPVGRAEVVRRLGLDPGRPHVLYAGRIDRTKGISALAAAVRGMSHPAQLVLCGPETDRAFGRELRDALGDLAVAWVGRQPSMTELLAAVDVLVLPSLVPETQGLVVAEAMSCGTPALASDIGGLPETLVGFPEHLFPPGDVSALTSLLDRFVDWRHAAPELGASLRAWVVDHLRLGTTVGSVSDLLECVGRAGVALR